MFETEYRVFFDGRNASRSELDMLESVIVELETDMAAEARLEIPICADDDGNWAGHDGDHLRGLGRIRIEVRVGDGGFRALIDGPIVGRDTNVSSQPGQSSVTILVHDDSVYLNREEGVENFGNKSDSEIAQQIYAGLEQISSTRIDSTQPPAEQRSEEVLRGTHMRLLRTLARRNNMHAYVLPGAQAGASVGVFESYPTEPDGLTPLVLTGSDRNIETFDLRHDEESPCNVEVATLSITDKVVTTRRAEYRDVELLGTQASVTDTNAVATCRLRPGERQDADIQSRIEAEVRRNSFSIVARGVVRRGCYADILEPYRMVTVRGVTPQESGDYVISSVVHTLTRSEHRQEFALVRNARSSSSSSSLPGGIS